MINQGVRLVHDDYYTKTFEIDGCDIEMHRDADVNNEYFDDIFLHCTYNSTTAAALQKANPTLKLVTPTEKSVGQKINEIK